MGRIRIFAGFLLVAAGLSVTPAAHANPYQPDASISLSGGPSKGLTIFNTNAQMQTVKTRVRRGHTASYLLNVNNAGSANDDFLFKGCRSSRGFSVHYYKGPVSPSNDVTAAVVAGTYQTPVTLSPTSGYGLGMNIKVGRSGPPSKRCLVTLTSVGGATRDAVAGKVVAR